VAKWYLYDHANGIATPIYSDQPALDQYRIASKHPIHFHAWDGMLLHGYVSLPVDAKKKERLPMVILVHGGPERRDEWSYDPWPVWLADRGYAVLQINFRASDGFGKQYRISGYHQWSGAMRTDILDGKAWAVQHKIADPKRICIMGGAMEVTQLWLDLPSRHPNTPAAWPSLRPRTWLSGSETLPMTTMINENLAQTLPN
jgi:dipeptidyl aminopeptidase/acylaminoacyl peptidase